jgi:hypothetical protein
MAEIRRTTPPRMVRFASRAPLAIFRIMLWHFRRCHRTRQYFPKNTSPSQGSTVEGGAGG